MISVDRYLNGDRRRRARIRNKRRIVPRVILSLGRTRVRLVSRTTRRRGRKIYFTLDISNDLGAEAGESVSR